MNWKTRLCVGAGWLLGLGLMVPLTAQTASLSGKITASDSGDALESVNVRVLEPARRSNTDRFGLYQLDNLPVGTVEVVVSAPGYNRLSRSVTLEEGSNLVDFSLAFSEEVIELDDLEVVTSVSGAARALAQQRAADNRVDVIASDDFGQLPDQTIADAVRRLPGVSVEKDTQGRAGRYVTIRGLNSDFNTVSVNGQKLVVSNFDGASRSVPLDVITADNAESIEVSKTSLPSQDGDAIGGAINIRTRSAFDHEEMYLQIDGRLGYNDLADRYEGDYPFDDLPYELSVQWSDYLNENETLGLAFGINYLDRAYLFQSIENGPYGFVDFDQAYLPQYGRIEEAFDDVQTLGLTSRIDYRPSNDFSAALSLSYTERESVQGSQRADTRYFDGLLFNPIVVENGTFRQFESDDRLARRVRDFHETQEVFTAQLELFNRVGDFEIEYGAGYDRAEFGGNEDDTSAQFRTGFMPTFFDSRADAFNPDYGDNITEEPSGSYGFDVIDRGTRVIEDASYALYADVTYDFLVGEATAYFKTGVKGIWRERDFDAERIRYRFAQSDLGLDYTLDGVFIDGNAVYGSLLADYNAAETLQGNSFGFMIDPEKVRAAEAAVFEYVEANGLGDPQAFLGRDAAQDARFNLIDSYEAEESIYAAYLEGGLEWEKLTLIFGVRLEHTEVEFNTYGGDFFVSDETAEAYIQPVFGDNDYTNVLPGVHLRYEPTEAIVVRASVNQTIARPSYRQLNPSIDYVDDGPDSTATTGSTALDPVESLNLEASVDYYFGVLSRVSAGVFYKDMTNNVYRLTRGYDPERDPDFFDPQTSVSQFLNAEGAQVTGLELGFELAMGEYTEALTGLTLLGNLTVVDAEVEGIQRNDENGDLVTVSDGTPLFGQVDLVYNLILLYQKRGFDARLAFNYTDDYLDFNGIDADRNLDEFVDSRERWDLSLGYQVTDKFRVYGEIQNLLDDDSAAYQGSRDRLIYREESGRTFFLGVTYTH